MSTLHYSPQPESASTPAEMSSPETSEASSRVNSELKTNHLHSHDHPLTAPPSPATSVETPGVLKRKRRAFLACERCRARKIRCNVDNGIPCHNCVTDDCDCTPARPKKAKSNAARRNERCMNFKTDADTPWSIHSAHSTSFQHSTAPTSVTRDTTLRKLALQQKRRATVESAEHHGPSIISERLALWLAACPLNLRYELYSHLNIHGHWSRRFKNRPDPGYLQATLAYSIECVHEEMNRLCEKLKTETVVDVVALDSGKTGSIGSSVDLKKSFPQDAAAVIRESITRSNNASLRSAAELRTGVCSQEDHPPDKCILTNAGGDNSRFSIPSALGHILIPADTDEVLHHCEEKQQYSDSANSGWVFSGNSLQEGFIDIDEFLIAEASTL